MEAAEELHLFTSAKSVPASDESPVCRGGYIVGRGVTGQNVASVNYAFVRWVAAESMP